MRRRLAAEPDTGLPSSLLLLAMLLAMLLLLWLLPLRLSSSSPMSSTSSTEFPPVSPPPLPTSARLPISCSTAGDDIPNGSNNEGDDGDGNEDCTGAVVRWIN